VLGLLILSVMALTSNRWAMKWLGKHWKRLHRLVYLAGCAVIVHAMLATTTKRVFLADPQVIDELRLYLAVLVGLLAVRVPLVRNRLKKWLHFPVALRRKPHAAQ
jgi:sulfoxide reductase heme-binding subunit YedZ